MEFKGCSKICKLQKKEKSTSSLTSISILVLTKGAALLEQKKHCSFLQLLFKQPHNDASPTYKLIIIIIILMKIVALALFLLGLAYSQHTCGGKPNMNDIITGDAVLIAKAKNALKMHVPQDTNKITIVRLYGSAKDVGVAQGTIVK